MKKLIFPTIFILMLSCKNTTSSKWDAETASKSCFDAATKGKYNLTDKQIKRLKGICNCVGEKMVADFKTEEEANKKVLDAAVNANECQQQWDKNPLNQ
ncbi:MAG: hypothetical protein KA319_01150 [Ferruginibacter sp.]|nr:hypothetical protein [Ferruginibacter sp.]